MAVGGPAAHLLMLRMLVVERRRWLDDSSFAHATSVWALFPGPEATQVAAYTGWKIRGLAGGLIAGSLFILPGYLCLLLLGSLYVNGQDLPWLQAAFLGLRCACIPIVLNAGSRLATEYLVTVPSWMLLFVALVILNCVPGAFPGILAISSLLGWLGCLTPPTGDVDRSVNSPLPGDSPSNTRPISVKMIVRQRTLVLLVWLAIWWAPFAVLVGIYGRNHLWVRQFAFFSWMSIVSFGGAYAVLDYIRSAAIGTYGWVTPQEMQDSISIADAAPGPLIQAVEFIGFLSSSRQGDGPPSMTDGVVGATWAIFAPTFLLVHVFAPAVSMIQKSPPVRRMLVGVMVAIIASIINLSLWMAVETLFIIGNAPTGKVAFSVNPAATFLVLMAMVSVIVRPKQPLWAFGGTAVAAVILELISA